MRTRTFILSYAYLLFTFLTTAGALFFFSLSYSNGLRQEVVSLILDHSLLLRFIGLGALLFALFLIYTYRRIRGKKFYQIKWGDNKALVDKIIIEEYVQDYWKESFPDEPELPEVTIRAKNRLEIMARLPKVSEDDEEGLLSRVENELGVLLARHLGYEDDLYLTLIEKN